MKKTELYRLLEIAFGILIGFLVIGQYFREKKNFADLALGGQTTSYQAKNDTNLIHICRINPTEESSLMNGWKARGEKQVLLCLGNSQTHSINQMKAGEVVYAELLHQRFNQTDTNREVLCASIPNVNMEELLLVFEYWHTKIPIQAITLPVFMDDFREEGIRDVFFGNLVSDKFQISDSSSAVVKKINKTLRKMKPIGAGDEGKSDLAALDATVQEKSETFLNDWLNIHFSPWSYRPNVRGAMFNDLYLLRNTVFGITAETKRKMIPQRYSQNMDALRTLLEHCQSSGIKMILYIPPIRNDVEVPYNLQEYDAFKQEISILAAQFHSDFYNWEGIVPAKLWGVKASTNGTGKSELDYMHFQYQGHVILADSLLMALKKSVE